MPSDHEVKFQFLQTLTSHATAYLGPILLKQGQSPKSVAKIISDYSIACYDHIAVECGMINRSPKVAQRRID